MAVFEADVVDAVVEAVEDCRQKVAPLRHKDVASKLIRLQ